MAKTYIHRSDKRTVAVEEQQAETIPLVKKKMENLSSGQTLYIGEAYPGTSTSEARWRIQKMEYDDGENMPPTGIVWADGTSEFTKVWDDRTTYTYS